MSSCDISSGGRYRSTGSAHHKAVLLRREQAEFEHRVAPTYGDLSHLMQFASVQEPAGNVRSLKGRPLGWRMRRQVAANPDQDVPALAEIGPFPELAHPGLQHLTG